MRVTMTRRSQLQPSSLTRISAYYSRPMLGWTPSPWPAIALSSFYPHPTRHGRINPWELMALAIEPEIIGLTFEPTLVIVRFHRVIKRTSEGKTLTR